MPNTGNPVPVQPSTVTVTQETTVYVTSSIRLPWSSAAIILATVCMIWSQKVSAIASVAIRMQHPVDIPFANETVRELTWLDRDWYRVGALDFVTTAAYMLIALVAVTCVEKLLLIGPVQNVNRPNQAARYSAMLVYHALTVIHAVVIARGHFGLAEVWNGYPGTHMPFVSKLFLVWQIGFCAHCFFYDRTFKEPTTASIPENTEVYFQLVLWSISLFASNSMLPLIVLLTVPHAILGFVTALASLCELAGTNDILIIALRAVFKYVTVCEHVWTMVASVVMCCLGEQLPIAFRLLATILSLCWGSSGLLTFYFFQHEERQQAASHATHRLTPATRGAARNATRSPAYRRR